MHTLANEGTNSRDESANLHELDVYICAYGISYSPLAWALPSEVYSTVQRSKGVALATATVWLSNFIVGVATPPMISQAGFGKFSSLSYILLEEIQMTEAIFRTCC